MNSTDILNLVLNEIATNLTNATNQIHNDHDHNSKHHHIEQNNYDNVNGNYLFKSSNNSIDHEDHDHDHDHDHDTAQKNIIIAKATAMVVLFCASTLCGCIPFLLNRRYKWTEKNTNARSAIVVKCLLYFGGGVLLCTTFLHLLPEVKENIQALQSKHVLPDFKFNFAELLMCLGFFAMFLVEELIHTYIHRHNKDAQTATGAFVRGISITESILVKRKSNCSSASSSRTTTSLANDLNDNDKKKSSSNDIEKNQQATLNGILNEIIDEDQNKDVNTLSTKKPTTTPSLGITNNGFVNDSKDNSGHDHIFKKNPTNNNSNNYYIQSHENSPHNEHHHHDHEKTKDKNNHHHHHHHHHDHEGGHHGHSHLPIGLNEDHIVASLRGLLVVLALSIHELFEGLAVGLESQTDNVWYMFGAVSAHKLVLAFCVGVELIVTRTKLWLAITYVITFAIVSPIGIGIGILVSTTNSTASAIPSAILQGLATGTLLYVVFFEILSKERSGLIPYASFVVGFAVMFGLQFATGHEHSHDHGHSHDNVNAHGSDHLKYQNNLNDDEIDYTKKSIQEQIEILRAAGRELLEKNNYQLGQFHHQQHHQHDHHEHNE